MSSVADENFESLLRQSQDALRNHRHAEAWHKLDCARRNYPHLARETIAIEAQLARVWSARERIGRVRILTWPRDSVAALTPSFDDGYPSQLAYGATGLSTIGVKGSFYLTLHGTRVPQQTKAWAAAAASGHEIGGHTSRHLVDLPALPPSQIRQEIAECDAFIASQITRSRVLTFAYPHSNAGSPACALRAVIRETYLAARAGRAGSPHNPATPPDLHSLTSFPIRTCTTASELLSAVEGAEACRGWLVPVFHAVVEPDGFQPVSEATWHGFLSMIGARWDRLWVASMRDVARYVLARKAARASWERLSEDVLQVSVLSNECTSDNVHLSIKVELPPEWLAVEVVGRAGAIVVRSRCVTMDIVPDGALLLLRAVATRLT